MMAILPSRIRVLILLLSLATSLLAADVQSGAAKVCKHVPFEAGLSLIYYSDYRRMS